jgi:serine/threonine-protein kinase
MGEVCRARDERLDRDVAIKILPLNVRDDLRARDRLLEEARSASQLNHSHIYTIYEVNEEGSIAFIAMEYVAGRSLSAIIPPEGLSRPSRWSATAHRSPTLLPMPTNGASSTAI